MRDYQVIGGPLDGATVRVPDDRAWVVHHSLLSVHPAMLHVYAPQSDRRCVYVGIGRLDGGETDWTAVSWVSYEDAAA